MNNKARQTMAIISAAFVLVSAAACGSKEGKKANESDLRVVSGTMPYDQEKYPGWYASFSVIPGEDGCRETEVLAYGERRMPRFRSERTLLDNTSIVSKEEMTSGFGGDAMRRDVFMKKVGGKWVGFIVNGNKRGKLIPEQQIVAQQVVNRCSLARQTVQARLRAAEGILSEQDLQKTYLPPNPQAQHLRQKAPQEALRK